MASEIASDHRKSNAYIKISKILMEQGKKDESLKVASEITDNEGKSESYLEISKVLLEQGKKEESLEVIKESLKVASQIRYAFDKSRTYLEISKILMEQGKKAESLEVIKESLKVASEITSNYDKSWAYIDITSLLIDKLNKREFQELIVKFLKVVSKITDNQNDSDESYYNMSRELIEKGKKEESLRLAANINLGDFRLPTFVNYGKRVLFNESHNLQLTINSEKSKTAFIQGVSEKINEENELSEAVNPYLYNYSEYTQNLPNILIHQAKIACFFEKDHSEKKLDMLSEVLDITDWRRISASA